MGLVDPTTAFEEQVTALEKEVEARYSGTSLAGKVRRRVAVARARRRLLRAYRTSSWARPQPVEAIPLVRSSAKTSAGFLQSRILRGRPLISRATAHR